jgi:hypothetical protein
MYDWPYRIEQRHEPDGYVTIKTYVVMRTGDGIICQSESYTALRRLVDAANMAASLEAQDRGR